MAAAAARTVVVVNAATPVLMPWADEVDAVLWAGLPGQEGGHAVAAALLGDIEPAGRLVTTFPAADGAAPAWSVTPVDGELPYSRGPLHRVPRARRGAGTGARRSGSGTASATAAGSTPTPGVRRATGDAAAWSTVAVRNTSARGSPRGRAGLLRARRGRPAGAARRLEPPRTVPAGGTAEVTVACDARMLAPMGRRRRRWDPLGPDGELLVARGLGDVRHRLRVRSGGHRA